jgi:hypothetical protein
MTHLLSNPTCYLSPSAQQSKPTTAAYGPLSAQNLQIKYAELTKPSGCLFVPIKDNQTHESFNPIRHPNISAGLFAQ